MNPTFKNYLESKGYSQGTIEGYIRNVKDLEKYIEKENIEIEQVSYTDLLYYVQSHRNKISQGSIAKKINSIRHYFNYLVSEKIVIVNPSTQIEIKGIKRKVLHDIFTKIELESLYKNFINENEQNQEQANKTLFKTAIQVQKRNKIILGMMIYQGLGTHEISVLEEQDIKLREGKIYIAGSRRSQERELPLEAHQIIDIMEYIYTTRKEIISEKIIDNSTLNTQNSKLFISIGSSEKLNNSMQYLLQTLQKQNKRVKNLQQIRASVITHWLKIHNLRQVQYMAGHRYISSTESYIINDLEDLLEDVNKYHPLE